MRACATRATWALFSRSSAHVVWLARALMWAVAAAWTALTLLAISFEERELRTRFGAAYEDYCRQVPRFVPIGAKPREGYR